MNCRIFKVVTKCTYVKIKRLFGLSFTQIPICAAIGTPKRTQGTAQSPLALSLSKGEWATARSWFDKLTTNGIRGGLHKLFRVAPSDTVPHCENPRLRCSPTRAITLFGSLLLALLAGCKTPDLKPDFLKRNTTTTDAVPTAVTVDPSLTPRELLTARLINTRRADSKSPGLTVGKLIEFADRYLACDCANARFAKTWRHIEGGYELATNANQVKPLRFMCRGEPTALDCYLTEIDRGAQLAELTERFMPGADFIEFIYQNGSHCPRTAPCPEPVAGVTAPTPRESE